MAITYDANYLSQSSQSSPSFSTIGHPEAPHSSQVPFRQSAIGPLQTSHCSMTAVSLYSHCASKSSKSRTRRTSRLISVGNLKRGSRLCCSFNRSLSDSRISGISKSLRYMSFIANHQKFSARSSQQHFHIIAWQLEFFLFFLVHTKHTQRSTDLLSFWISLEFH